MQLNQIESLALARTLILSALETIGQSAMDSANHARALVGANGILRICNTLHASGQSQVAEQLRGAVGALRDFPAPDTTDALEGWNHVVDGGFFGEWARNPFPMDPATFDTDPIRINPNIRARALLIGAVNSAGAVALEMAEDARAQVGVDVIRKIAHDIPAPDGPRILGAIRALVGETLAYCTSPEETEGFEHVQAGGFFGVWR